jgi:hypothetical protein
VQVDVLRGRDLRGFGLQYPPLFFILLDVFLRFLDEFTALKVVASLVFSLIAIPFFLFAKKISGNFLVALISTWLFVFFEGYSEMIGWGGNPNFLAFSFALFALFFLIKSFEESSKKNILLSGFFLSLVVGTHLLVTVFMFFCFLVFLALMWSFSRKYRSRMFKVVLFSGLVALALSLPYIPFYINFYMYSTSELVGFNSLQQFGDILGDLAWMFRGQFVISAVMAVLGIFALRKYARDYKNEGLILCSLFLVPFILSLVTENPGRWYYFLPIPVIVCFSLYLKDLLPHLRNVRKEVLLLAFCFILLIVAETTISSVIRLETAVDYYQTIGDDELQALRWIRENTTLNAIFATSGPSKFEGVGNSYSWWIEGYSKRKCIPAGFQKWFSYQYEREEAIIANRIFTGTYSAEYSNIRMSISYPSGIGNPQIAILANGEYENVIFMRDDRDELFFSPIGYEQVILRETPINAENKSLNMQINEETALINITFTYEWTHLRLIKSIIVGLKESSIDVIFKVSPINATIRQFNINLWAANYTTLEDCSIKKSTITLHQKIAFNQMATTKITVLQTDGKILNSTVPLHDTHDKQTSTSIASYSLKPLNNGTLYVKFRISVTTNFPETTDNKIHFYSSYELIENLGINYILLDKSREIEYQRFLNDSEHFQKVFENKKIVIFNVI